MNILYCMQILIDNNVFVVRIQHRKCNCFHKHISLKHNNNHMILFYPCNTQFASGQCKTESSNDTYNSIAQLGVSTQKILTTHPIYSLPCNLPSIAQTRLTPYRLLSSLPKWLWFCVQNECLMNSPYAINMYKSMHFLGIQVRQSMNINTQVNEMGKEGCEDNFIPC